MDIVPSQTTFSNENRVEKSHLSYMPCGKINYNNENVIEIVSIGNSTLLEKRCPVGYHILILLWVGLRQPFEAVNSKFSSF